MDYQEMWKELKEILNEKITDCNKGEFYSIAECAFKESICIEILENMEEMEFIMENL